MEGYLRWSIAAFDQGFVSVDSYQLLKSIASPRADLAGSSHHFNAQRLSHSIEMILC